MGGRLQTVSFHDAHHLGPIGRPASAEDGGDVAKVLRSDVRRQDHQHPAEG